MVAFDVCSPVVSVCVCFASGFRLCKSWAGASSQPGGQTRKQMDLFGLNPSHATSSSGPRQTCTSLCRAEGRERSSWLWVCMEFGGDGMHTDANTSKQRRWTQIRAKRETVPLQTFSYTVCVSWTVLTHGSCLHVGPLLSPSSSFPSLVHFAVCFLSQTST